MPHGNSDKTDMFYHNHHTCTIDYLIFLLLYEHIATHATPLIRCTS